MDKDQTEYQIKDYDDVNNDVSLDKDGSDKSDPNLNIEYSLEKVLNELKKTKDELEYYRKSYDDTFNKLRYCLADFDNFRKNMEKQNTAKILSVRADMLSAIINFREDFIRALDIINQQKLDSSIFQGLKDILKNMDSFLEKENVRVINALNNVFNPNLHEIVGFSYFDEKDEEENGIKENIVTKDIRRGYLLNDKVLRPSMVEVSKKIIKNIDDNNKKNTLGDEV